MAAGLVIGSVLWVFSRAFAPKTFDVSIVSFLESVDFASLFSGGLDWDHIPLYIFNTPVLGFMNISGWPDGGRPFHTIPSFLLQSFVAAMVIGYFFGARNNHALYIYYFALFAICGIVHLQMDNYVVWWAP